MKSSSTSTRRIRRDTCSGPCKREIVYEGPFRESVRCTDCDRLEIDACLKALSEIGPPKVGSHRWNLKVGLGYIGAR